MSDPETQNRDVENSQHNHQVDEPDDEARRNRGVVTVFEQTMDTDTRDEGDRFVKLGYGTERHTYDKDRGEFIRVAVPIARIELHEPVDRETFDEWLNSEVAKMALAHYFPDVQPDVLTNWGAELVDDTEV